MRTLRGALRCTALFACLFCTTESSTADVSIIAPESKKAQYIKNELSNRLSLISSLKNHDLNVLVTIGSSTYLDPSAKNGGPYFPLFLSPYEHRAIPDREDVFPVFSEPAPGPLLDQLAVWFGAARIGYIYKGRDPFSSALIEQANRKGINLVPLDIGNDDVFDGITDLARKGIDLMLVSKHPDVYTSRNIRFVFESLYRKRIPAIATSDSLLNAGAIATISPDERIVIEDVAQYISTLFKAADKEKTTVERQALAPFSQTIKIQTNPTMQSQFGIRLPVKEDQ